MAYDPEHYFPGEHELAQVLENAPKRAWRSRHHTVAHRRSRLHLAGHNTLINTFRPVVGKKVLDLIDLGAELHGILRLPEVVGLDVEDVPTYEDSVGLQVAIGTANKLREFDESDLLGFATDAVMQLDEKLPVMAGLVTMVAGVMFRDTLPASMVKQVKTGAAIMEIMEEYAWCELGRGAA